MLIDLQETTSLYRLVHCNVVLGLFPLVVFPAEICVAFNMVKTLVTLKNDLCITGRTASPSGSFSLFCD